MVLRRPQVDGVDLRQALLSTLRDRNTSTARFRWASDRLARLLCAKTLSALGAEGNTGTETTTRVDEGVAIPGNVMIVPVLRAAVALVPAFTEMMPDAPVGMIGVERDETTALPKIYYRKFPADLPRRAVILDPMLATGGTACAAVETLMGQGYEPCDIYFTGVLAAPEGMSRLSDVIPRSNITVAAVDLGLDARKFIVPGLGDYGDRYYGT